MSTKTVSAGTEAPDWLDGSAEIELSARHLRARGCGRWLPPRRLSAASTARNSQATRHVLTARR